MNCLALRNWLLACVLVLFLPLRAVAAEAAALPTLPKGVELVASVEGITEYRLDNGLRALLFPDESKQSVTVNVTYLVGSRHEGYGETGMAHLLEHLLFKGTPTHPNIPGELTQRGARSNGTTSFDRTNYFETLNATPENLEWALRMEADRMVNSFVAKKDLDSEMTVVRNEYESGENSPARVLIKRMHGVMYDWHNYGKLPIGNRSDIENVGIERLQAFYRTYYQPDNAVVLVVGRFNEAFALNIIAESFGRIAKPERTLPAIYTQEPAQDGEREFTLRRVGDTPQIAVGYRVPSGAHTDAPALDVLAYVLGDTPSGRLYKALVEPKKAVGIGASQMKLHDPGVLVFEAQLRKEDAIEPARTALIATVHALRELAPTEEEVARAKAAFLKQIETTISGADRLGLALSNWMGMGDWRLFFLYRDRLKQVSVEDVTRVARQYLKTANRTVGVFMPEAAPDRAEIPATPDIAALVKDYKGDPSIQLGEAFDPSPQNIHARTKRIDLPSGLRLALLPKKTRGARVVVQLSLRFGTAESLRGQNTAAMLAGDMLMRGTARMTRQELEDAFDRLGAQVSVAGEVSGAVASVETKRENLGEVLRLVAQILRAPRFEASEFEQIKAQRLSAIEQQLSDPRALASQRFSRHLSPYPRGDVRYVATFDEQIASLKAATLEQARAFHQDFYGASNAEAALVGDFDDVAMAALLQELFGDWKSPQAFARIGAQYHSVAPLDEQLQIRDKANAFLLAGTSLEIRDDEADAPALVLANEILGGGFLHSRLATRIRQKEGLSYGVGSRLIVGSEDRVGRLTAYAIYAPQNLQRLEAALREELARAVQGGFSEEEISQARSGLMQRFVLNRAQDGSLAAALIRLMQLGRTPLWDAEAERKLAALTAADVNVALRRHVDPARFTVIKAGDFPKGGAKTGG